MTAQQQPPLPSVFTPQTPPTNPGPGLPPTSHVLPPSTTRPALRPSYPQHPAVAPGLTICRIFEFICIFCPFLFLDIMTIICGFSQVSLLTSHSSLSHRPLLDFQRFHLQVLLCQLLPYQGLNCHLHRQLLEAYPPCPAPGCHQQASCHLPPQALHHLAPSLEPRFQCTQEAFTTRVLHLRLFPMLLPDLDTHRVDLELLLQSPSQLQWWLLLLLVWDHSYIVSWHRSTFF